MSTRNQNPQDDIFSKEQEEVIKRSFENFEQKLGISKETPEYLKKSFERKLVALSEPNKSFSVTKLFSGITFLSTENSISYLWNNIQK